MFKQALTILILTTLSIAGFAQKASDRLIIHRAAFDSVNKAYIIPDSIFSMQVDVLRLTRPSDTIDSKEKYGYEIRWSSDCIDGFFDLTITKRQIYLRSSHDNPNPNRLYWAVNITGEQYKIIASKIKTGKKLFKSESSKYSWYTQLYYKKPRREKGVPETWTKKDQDEFYKDCLDKRYNNTNDLISFLVGLNKHNEH